MKDKPKAYTAWLIERRDPLRFWDGRDWVESSEDAVKFRFEEDALRVMAVLDQIHHTFKMVAVSHQWGFTDELVEGA